MKPSAKGPYNTLFPSAPILRSACVPTLKVTLSQPSGSTAASPEQFLAAAADLQTGTPGHAAKVSQQTAGQGHAWKYASELRAKTQ